MLITVERCLLDNESRTWRRRGWIGGAQHGSFFASSDVKEERKGRVANVSSQRSHVQDLQLLPPSYRHRRKNGPSLGPPPVTAPFLLLTSTRRTRDLHHHQTHIHPLHRLQLQHPPLSLSRAHGCERHRSAGVDIELLILPCINKRGLRAERQRKNI